jgi:signal peptidase II
LKRVAWALGLCGAVVALDQGTKALVDAVLAPGERLDIALGFQLADVHNRGVAFGLFAGDQAPMIAISVLAIGLLAAYLARHASQPGAWLAAALIGGGALGNLADRARDGYVRDFLDPPAWPAFNVADVAIVVGVGLILLRILREQAA